MQVEPISYRVEAGVAVARIDNPPVNALGPGVRHGLMKAIQAASADPQVAALILTGTGNAFVGGADIREFGKPYADPNLWDINNALLTMRKPVVAAINGFAFGGGFELALHCHWRVASPNASIGLPEVRLGLMPGAGGTQYWTRLAGPESALKSLTSGAPVSARDASALGLIDAVVDGDILAGAIDFVRHRLGSALPDMAARTQRINDVDPELFDRFRAENAARWKGPFAQNRIVDCIEAACFHPLPEGLALEKAAFAECEASPQAKALMHLFFAERKAGKISDTNQGGEAERVEIRSAGVIGAGTMGGGIAMALANAGIAVTLVDVSDAALDRGLDIVAGNYATSVKRGSMRQATADAALARIGRTTALEDLNGCDLIIEAVFEDMDVKRDLIARLDSVSRPDAILASNTSTLDIDALAAASTRPDRFVGMHFFSPANVMKLLEVVRGGQTRADVLASVLALGKRMGKIPVLAGNGEGFIGNYILDAYGREADFLIEDGATPWQVDAVMREFGFAMGLFAMRDMAGLDVIQRVRQQRREWARPGRYPLVADRICALGRFGQKSGKGYYVYDGRKGSPDPEIDVLIETVSGARGIARRPVKDTEISQRILCAMVNAGVRLLEQGIAQRASDIDLVMVHGYGFPAYRGGPMHWAEQQGLAVIVESIREFQAADGDRWTPAPLLERLAQQGLSWPD